MIKVAQRHADKTGGSGNLTYKQSRIEDVDDAFDIVVASEVIEHVPNTEVFLKECIDRVNPEGGIVLTTINRTFQSWLFAIMIAENVAGLVPPGTHEYRKLVRPEEITGILSEHGFTIHTLSGMSYNPLTRQWSLSSDMSVNYAITAIRQ